MALKPLRRYAAPYLLISSLTSISASSDTAVALTLTRQHEGTDTSPERVRPLAPHDHSLLTYGPTELLSCDRAGFRMGRFPQLVNVEEAPRWMLAVRTVPHTVAT